MWERVFQNFSFDVADVLHALVTLAIAFVIALPLAWEREKAAHSAGLRTFPLVATASAAYILVGHEALGRSEGSGHQYVVQGLMTGLGFLGGGAILKSGEIVHGMATATALWSTAAIGAAVAYGRLEIALILAALDFAGLRLMQPLKARIETEEGRRELRERQREERDAQGRA